MAHSEEWRMRREASAEARAELAFSQALWYAWGRIDSGEYREYEVSPDPFRFASLVKEATLAFELEQTFQLESIQGAWEKFVKVDTEPEA